MSEDSGRSFLGGADRVFFMSLAGKPFAWKTSFRWCSSCYFDCGLLMLCARSFIHLYKYSSDHRSMLLNSSVLVCFHLDHVLTDCI